MRIRTETSVGLFILVAIGIFLYMSFQIGVIRFDTARYQRYFLYFNDVSGLAKKAEVKISGVKVGWVDGVELAENSQQVRVAVMILSSYALYQDAYGIVRQDGLLGTKYIELIPGDPLLAPIPPEGILMKPSKEPVSVDEVLFKMRDIAQNVDDLSRSLKDAVAGDGVQRLKNTVESFNKAADRIAEAAESLGGIISRNSNALDTIIQDVQSVAGDLKRDLPGLATDLRDSAQRLASSIESTTEPVKKMAEQVSEGEGILGRLVHDENMGHSLKVTVDGFKKYFGKAEKLAFTFDNRFESMYGLGNYLYFEDAKWYFNVLIHPQEDYFFLAGLMRSYSGKIARTDNYRRWYNDDGKQLVPTEMQLADNNQLWFAALQRNEKRIYDKNFWNAQFGKTFGPFSLRFGLFESTFGIGLDVDVPLGCDSIQWTTSFEGYDFSGRNRVFDDRPHLKWLNRFFFANTFYATFGADDFFSKTNKNAFFGFGLIV